MILKIQHSRGCSGLAYIPKSVRNLTLEFCNFKSDAAAELEALKVSHPEAEVAFIKCVEEKDLEGKAEKGKSFLISKKLVAGAIQDLS